MAARTESHVAVAPYGSWESTLSIDELARLGPLFARFSSVRVDDDAAYWVESRPAEAGRGVVVKAEPGAKPTDLTPPGYDVRSRVHEYGGGAYWLHRGQLFFTNFGDGRVYRTGEGGDPQPITPEPPQPASVRFADGVVSPDGMLVVCVRETHGTGGVVNEIVAFPADGSAEPRAIVSGRDFYASPRLTAGGDRLAWLEWEFPQMPWDGTELWTARFLDGRALAAERVAGGRDESILQPEWADDGTLYFVSDRTGWWNVYRLDREPRAVASAEADFGFPAWQLGQASYAFLGDGRIAAAVSRDALWRLVVVDREGGIDELDLPYTYFGSSIRARRSSVYCVAAGPREPPAVVEIDVQTRSVRTVAAALASAPAHGDVSVGRAIRFPTGDGEEAHAFYYPPANARFRAPEGERPPLRLTVHGGPTSQAACMYEPTIQFWTSRGFAVVDVNYRGSTGFGRAYRRALYGRWGEADVEDCVAAVRYLADRGDVDGRRVAIAGGSAGGYTALLALAHSDAFSAAVNAFGVVDLASFANVTHKFEERYDELLIGPRADRDLYRRRSPINHLDKVSAPVLTLQGLDDKVVPPSQSELLVEALARRGIPYAYLSFEGEGHGFRREETVRRTLEAALYFLARVFGFEPADAVEPIEIYNL